MVGLGDDVLNKIGHASFCMRCLFGLPGTMAEADGSRVAVGFYCLGAMDIVGLLDTKTKEADRAAWREWIWQHQVRRKQIGAGPPSSSGHVGDGNDGDGAYIGGFRPSPFMDVNRGEQPDASNAIETDPPHLIMTYTALLALAILRDDFIQLDRQGLINFLRSTQKDDGSFTAIPGQGEADIRMVYTAFAISAMLDDWSGIDVEKAVGFVKQCMTYEGGFGQTPGNEAQGGPTYCAIATFALAPPQCDARARLTAEEHHRALRWLMQKQCEVEGGFRGRTEKDADVCYSFWCGAALDIIGANSFIDRTAHAHFLARCQFRIGGLAKAPEERADPYHTYLGLAALAIYSPSEEDGNEEGRVHESWALLRLDPLINATEETARWAREKISGKGANV